MSQLEMHCHFFCMLHQRTLQDCSRISPDAPPCEEKGVLYMPEYTIDPAESLIISKVQANLLQYLNTSRFKVLGVQLSGKALAQHAQCPGFHFQHHKTNREDIKPIGFLLIQFKPVYGMQALLSVQVQILKNIYNK